MKPFRKNLAIAIDGGGIKGIIITRALAIVEQHLGQPIHQAAGLTAGTSTGAIISAGLAAGLSAQRLFDLYFAFGQSVFRKSWRTAVWPLSRYRYHLPMVGELLRQEIGDLTMGDFWKSEQPRDVVLTTFDLLENRTRFVKPWKPEYQDWPVIKAVLASCAVPTYFQIVEGRYVDGGVGAYSNPCYLAAYELLFCLGWLPAETTLISLGTGRSPHSYDPKKADSLFAWQWLAPLLGAFQQSADNQQVHLVNTFFQELDFRRFQVDLDEKIEMDDVSNLPLLAEYGDRLGQLILDDHTDPAQTVIPRLAPKVENKTS